MDILLNLFALGIIIAVHEYGHFAQARRYDIIAPQFSVGIGPRIASIKRSGTDFVLRLFPIGGFVELDTENMPNASKRERIRILLAGPLANLAYCMVLAIPLALGPLSDKYEISAFLAVPLFMIITIVLFIAFVPLSVYALVTLIFSPIEKMDSVSGPIGIIKGGESPGIPAEYSSFDEIVIYSYMISLAVGTFNLLPLSMLDGGQITRELLPEKGNWRNGWLYSTSALFAVLVVYILVTDVYKIFT